MPLADHEIANPMRQNYREGLAPAVCRAGYLQFSGDRIFTNSRVQSRAFFWCKSGKGRFIVNGTECTLAPGDLYILPWDRTIRYIPDRKDPMYTGHVHLVPYYRPGSAWIPNVPHRAGDTAYNSPDRHDANWPDLQGVVKFKISGNDDIALLLDYTIRRFLRSRGSDEAEARQLGHLLLAELIRLQVVQGTEKPSYPEELVRLIAHIESAYMRSLAVTDLAAIIGRSCSHVLKLFRTHLGTSTKNYVIKRQLQAANELLLSTTKSIAEIGQAVGISDPYHFSKLFRRHMGLSPRLSRHNHGSIRLDLSGNP